MTLMVIPPKHPQAEPESNFDPPDSGTTGWVKIKNYFIQPACPQPIVSTAIVIDGSWWYPRTLRPRHSRLSNRCSLP